MKNKVIKKLNIEKTNSFVYADMPVIDYNMQYLDLKKACDIFL